MAAIGCLFAIAVQIRRYMSSTVWIFAVTTLIPSSRYRWRRYLYDQSTIYNTVVLATSAYALGALEWVLKAEQELTRRLGAEHVKESVFLSASGRRLAGFFDGIAPDLVGTRKEHSRRRAAFRAAAAKTVEGWSLA